MLRSFELRFVQQHVRLELEGADEGVDLPLGHVEQAFALAGPLLVAVREQAKEGTVRALSVDLSVPALLASLDPQGAAQLEGESLRAALEAAAPLVAYLQARARESLALREVTVKTEPSPALADESSLVLTAVGVPHRVEPPAEPGAPFTVLATATKADEARSALAAFEEENRPVAPAAPPKSYGETAVGLAFALVVVATHAFAHAIATPDQLDRGTSDAEQIVRGEWWRTATALTLHADAAHAGGNALFGAIALTALAHRLGPGAAAWIALVTGVLANGLTALFHRTGHVAIGASGAVFGALGALAAAQLAVPQGARRGRPALAIAASVAFLALLGTSQGADLLAHGFGMLTGFALGGLFAVLLRDPPRRSALQPVLAATALVAVALCWWRALVFA